MRSIPPRHRSALARRIAAGLPLWAAARGSAIPAEQVSELMGEPEFRLLVSAWSDIFALDDEARKRRLLTLASMIIEDRLEKGCPRTAWFVQHRYARKLGPREALAKGFLQLVEMEQARVLHFGRPAEPDLPAPSPPTPVHAALADAAAARRRRGRADPVDAAMWRQAGSLRRRMLGEQALFADAAPRPVEEIAEPQPRPEPRPEPPKPEPPTLNRAQRRRLEKMRKAKAARPAPAPAKPAPAGETPEAFRARAVKMFEATFAAAPAHVRAVLDRLAPEQRLALARQCWPVEEEFDESPQGP